MKQILSQLDKLIGIDNRDGELFLRKTKPHHIELFSNVLHTTKDFAPKELKPHLRRVLNATSARMAKGRMLKAHKETGGAFFDFLKKGASAVSNVAKTIGSTALEAAKNVYDKAVPLAQKGFEAAKPLIKEHGPTLLGTAASMIPIVGPVAGPVVKEGTKYLFGKLFG